MNVIAKVQCSESVDFFRPDRPRPTQNQTDPTQVDFRPKSTFLLWTETRTYLLSSLYCVRLPLPNIVMGLTQVDELAHFIQVACFDVRNNSVTGKQFVSKNYVKSTYSAIYAIIIVLSHSLDKISVRSIACAYIKNTKMN